MSSLPTEIDSKRELVFYDNGSKTSQRIWSSLVASGAKELYDIDYVHGDFDHYGIAYEGIVYKGASGVGLILSLYDIILPGYTPATDKAIQEKVRLGANRRWANATNRDLE